MAALGQSIAVIDKSGKVVSTVSDLLQISSIALISPRVNTYLESSAKPKTPTARRKLRLNRNEMQRSPREKL